MALTAAQRLGYLERIGLTAAPALDHSGLETLCEHHLRHIAFENLSVLLGETPSLEHEQLYRKIVKNGRGGYCFELNTLFSLLLEDLGFKLTRLMARVLHRNPNPKPSLSHKLLRVHLGSTSYLVDVGFGGLCPRGCLEIPPPGQVATSGRFRIVHPQAALADGRLELRLEARIGPPPSAWTCIYAFPLQAYAAHDYIQPNYCIANMPSSIFVRSLRCTLAQAPVGATSLLNGRWADLQEDLTYRERDNGEGSVMASETLRQRLAEELSIQVSDVQAEQIVHWLTRACWKTP